MAERKIEDREVKCYACKGIGYTEGSIPYYDGGSISYTIGRIDCKFCDGRGAILLPAFELIPTLLEPECTKGHCIHVTPRL